jgi:NAD dependent epimerase/dehydratase family enzyme
MPWIHIDDLVGILLHAARSEALRGPINGVAPAPVTNAAFTLALGRAVHRPAVLPMPAFALNVAFGEMSGMLMASQRVMPSVALRSGYAFSHPDLDGALASLLGPDTRRDAA